MSAAVDEAVLSKTDREKIAVAGAVLKGMSPDFFGSVTFRIESGNATRALTEHSIRLEALDKAKMGT